MANVDSVICLDVGGANLKVASAAGETRSVAFPLWMKPDELHRELQDLVDGAFPNVECFGLAITGELADCYATRAEGVRRIISQVQKAVPSRPLFVYCIGHGWLKPEQVKGNELRAAASNWHCLASWIGEHQHAEQVDLLIDIGSTTVDVIPFCDGKVATEALTDRERLQASQLVYTGLERTPIASIVQSVVVAGQVCPVMAERFADSADAYIVRGLLEEDATNTDTADGRPKTRQASLGRLARMVGEDSETLSEDIINAMAEQIIQQQVDMITRAALENLRLEPLPDRRDALIVLFSGHARGLEDLVIKRLELELDATQISFRRLSDELGLELSRSAPAFAGAELLRKHMELTAGREAANDFLDNEESSR